MTTRVYRITCRYQMVGDVTPETWLHELLSVGVRMQVIKAYKILKYDFTKVVTCEYTFQIDVEVPGDHWNVMVVARRALERIIGEDDIEIFEAYLLSADEFDTQARYGIKYFVTVKYDMHGKTHHGPFDTYEEAVAWLDRRLDEHSGSKSGTIRQINNIAP